VLAKRPFRNIICQLEEELMSHFQKLRKVGLLFDRAVSVIRTGRRIPPNTVTQNRKTWQIYDWSQQGEEWTISPEWKQRFIDELLLPNIPLESRVLEIGPGAGRWTEHLIPRASKLTLVDVTPECIRLCRERFGDRAEYHVNDGSDLSFVPDASIDRIWSFDVFVHIAPDDIGKYVSQFHRVLTPGGIAVIHHSAYGRNAKGWRSEMTAEMMQEFCARFSLELLRQFDSCAGHGFELGDVVSMIRKTT
jgi:ubiquinone/menaquinone biosynthesis C-methylase UbiE